VHFLGKATTSIVNVTQPRHFVVLTWRIIVRVVTMVVLLFLRIPLAYNIDTFLNNTEAPMTKRLTETMQCKMAVRWRKVLFYESLQSGEM
jgi:hypothetical protein